MNKDGGFGLFGFLCFVAIVSIAFGVSMQAAFWGIVACGAILFVGFLAWVWFMTYSESRPQQPKITEAKIVQPKKQQAKEPLSIRIKHYAIGTILVLLVGLWFFSGPIIFGILDSNPATREFFYNHHLSIGLISFIPFVTPFVVYWAMGKKANKKHTNKKR